MKTGDVVRVFKPGSSFHGARGTIIKVETRLCDMDQSAPHDHYITDMRGDVFLILHEHNIIATREP